MAPFCLTMVAEHDPVKYVRRHFGTIPLFHPDDPITWDY